jgi:hydroxymethylpyrimidine/phosphomethylpyrimidine kinase
MREQRIARALTIAGSDSGGGAGIEADLKTFLALGAYGMAAITSITAQNTLGVFGIHDIPAEVVAQQIDVVADDIGVDAAKTGMLSSAAIIEAVAGSVRRSGIELLVVDPVMVAKSGDKLLRDEAQAALKELLLPLALVVTPNVPEAEVLSGRTITNEADLRAAGDAILKLGPRYVILKGGHMAGAEVVDYLYDGDTMMDYRGLRFDTPNTHGTGCTFAAAITAGLARGETLQESMQLAKEYVTGGIRNSLALGKGHGPLNHGWRIG